jgi:hypothetical protein
VTGQNEPGNPGGSNSPCNQPDTIASANPCIQIIAQAPQTETVPYQPPLPLTIVGTGFGYLPGLPTVTQYPRPSYIDIQEWTPPGPNQPGATKLWDTASATGNCQVYIADWTDTTISLLLGLPVGPQNANELPLSVLTDMRLSVELPNTR